MSQIAFSFVWGLLVLLSWIGWGKQLGRWIDQQAGFDIGLCAGWGVAVVLFFGGVLTATRLCSLTTVIAITLVGVGLLVLEVRRTPRELLRMPSVAFLPLAIILLVVYCTSLAWLPGENWNLVDDYAAYLTYPVKMLQTGAADDPYSLRRITTLGGPAFLQATACFPRWPESAFIVDMGLGNILCVLLMAGFLRRQNISPLMASILCCLYLLLPLGRINTMLITVGIAEFLTLFLTLRATNDSTKSARRRLHCVAGAVATAIVTLRPNFIPSVALLFFFCGMLWCLRGKQPLQAVIGNLIVSIAIAALCFLPWSISLYRSSGSFLWPFMHGNQQLRFKIISAGLPFWPLVAYVVFFFCQPLVFVMVGMGALALRVWAEEALALWSAAIGGALATIVSFTMSDYPNLTRYSLPPLAAAAIAGLLCSQSTAASARLRKISQAFVILLFATQLFVTVTDGRSAPAILSAWNRGLWWKLPLIPSDRAVEYAEAQSIVPAGRTVLCMTNYPFLFDFRRNKIFCADFPGMASPGAAMPFAQGPKALADYLKAHDINWLICDDFNIDGDSTYCERSYWNYRLSIPPDTDGRVPTDQICAVPILDFMDSVDALAASEPSIFNKNGLRVIPLKQ